jgi:hypothetical protein
MYSSVLYAKSFKEIILFDWLENVAASTSQSPMGFHGLITVISLPFFYPCRSRDSSEVYLIYMQEFAQCLDPREFSQYSYQAVSLSDVWRCFTA